MDILIELILEIILAAVEYNYEKRPNGRKMDITSSDKQNPAENKRGISNIYELKKQEHKFFLLVAALLYVYYEEDLNFSFIEKQKVRKYIKLSRIITHKKTRKDLKKMIKYRVNMENLRNIVKDYNLTQEEVNETFKLIDKHMSKKDSEYKYTSLLRSVHSNLIREF